MPINSLRWNITDLCNFKCEYCIVHDEIKSNTLKPQLNLNDIKEKILPKIIQANIKEVGILGGEPTIRHDLSEIIEILNNNQIWTTLITNGSLLHKEKCLSLSTSGLKRVVISIDSPDSYNKRIPKKYEENEDFMQRIIQAIQVFNQMGVEVTINTVLNRSNYLYFENMVEFCVNNNVSGLTVYFEVPSGNCEYQPLSKEELTNALIRLGKQSAKYPELYVECGSIRPLVQDYLQTSHNISINGVSKCGASTETALLLSDGRLVPCEVFSSHNQDIIDYCSLDEQENNILQKSFLEIWNSTGYNRVFEIIQDQDLMNYIYPCSVCKFFGECEPCPEKLIKTIIHEGSKKRTIFNEYCKYIYDKIYGIRNIFKIKNGVKYVIRNTYVKIIEPTLTEEYRLDNQGAKVWELIIRGFTENEMIDHIFKEFPHVYKTPQQVSSELKGLLNNLLEVGLIEREVF